MITIQLYKDVHESAITSVQLNPLDSSKIMTNGMDSKIKIVDIRTCKAIHEFSHGDFQTSYNWSSSVFSPDGEIIAFIYIGYFLMYIYIYIYIYILLSSCSSWCILLLLLLMYYNFYFSPSLRFLCVVIKKGAYVASGSSSNGFIFVWNAKNGKLIRKLESGHNDTGVCGLAWGRGGNNGQQVATVDKSGRLVLWS
jgi:WD40 repeat protein